MTSLRFLAIAGLIVATTACAQRADRYNAGRDLDAADADGDGAVSLSEFTESRARRFATLDKNGDGHLSMEDLGRLAARRESARERIQHALGQADTNSDGRVSAAEYNAATPALFARLDANRDGRLTAGEAGAASIR